MISFVRARSAISVAPITLPGRSRTLSGPPGSSISALHLCPEPLQRVEPGNREGGRAGGQAVMGLASCRTSRWRAACCPASIDLARISPRTRAWRNGATGRRPPSRRRISWRKSPACFELCDRHGHSMLQLAMGWLAAKSFVSSVIAGVTTVQQLEQNVAAAAWRGSAEELAEIDKIVPPPVSGFPGPRR